MDHCGYLVLHKGETARILYVGSHETADADWFFAEVDHALPPAKSGRRGWCPAGVLTKKPQAAKGPPPPPPPPPAQEPQRGAGGATASSSKAPRPAAAPAASGGNSSVPSSTSRPPGSNAGGGSMVTGQSKALVDKVFPALPVKQGTKQPAGGGGPAVPASQWHRGAGGGGAEGSQEQPEQAPRRQDAASLVASQRAAAAKAAAEAETATASRPHCQICMEEYSNRRRRTERPCCKVELCVQCDHKSLRSGKCYFCREESEQFPALELACRVAAS